MLRNRRILLAISDGIIAHKSLKIIRLLRECGASARCMMTEATCKLVPPLSVSAVSMDRTHCAPFSPTDDSETGHMRLSREAGPWDVAPATANILAKTVSGIRGRFTSAVLLATDKDVLVAPAMNKRMWTHPAANVSQLKRITAEKGTRSRNTTGLEKRCRAAATA